MLLIVLSMVFFGLAIKGVLGRQWGGNRFDAYFFILITLSTLCAWFPIRHALFEERLAEASERFLSTDRISVNCLSKFGGIFYLRVAGFVYRGSDIINLKSSTCEQLQAYLDSPALVDNYTLYSLHVLTHEAMHVAGEFNESLADCKAFQRNHKMAEQLGVPSLTAAINSRDLHRFRSSRHPYYSAECEPGRGMDEGLPDAVWVPSS
ncbi:MAG: hypothetical protein HON77_13580 [Gammaproteobacteria bacterium]|jgi:hypothetical protein|nr:hypothetical protein [Gammaproteobacteria bacterium]MBT5726014.1 hypothetical protein [Gammaproteobacteria bacterium]MBT6585332.1 hypothetical protein [Gammaproteobacteria bacterium]MBT7722723.1 hypothetical protein [Gammaproteobacteria bacterium]